MAVIRGALPILRALLVFGLFTPAAELRAQDDVQPAELPPDATLISDPSELSALLSGRTVHGAYLHDGASWREFSAPDGRTVFNGYGCLYPGTWRVSGSVVCYAYPDWDDGKPQCYVIYRSAAATHFVFLDLENGGHHLQSNAHEILDGNPDSLPLDLKTTTCSEPNV